MIVSYSGNTHWKHQRITQHTKKPNPRKKLTVEHSSKE